MVALQALLQNPSWSPRNEHPILAGETAQELRESLSNHPDNSGNTLAESNQRDGQGISQDTGEQNEQQ